MNWLLILIPLTFAVARVLTDDGRSTIVRGAGGWPEEEDMTRDYSQPGDPYGISEYTAQSADGELHRSTPPQTSSQCDLRGNTLCVPRSIPTQEEADALKK